MAIIVEHDKRKHEILEKALDVFAEEGYNDVTFQKIADRCGITRTTLYIYFNNKRDIFIASLKQLLIELEISIQHVIKDKDLSSEETLRRMMAKIVDCCQENYKMFNILPSYLIQLKKSGEDPNSRIQRRTIRLRHLLSTVIIQGIKNNEFKNINVHSINELLYNQLEACFFRMSMLCSKDLSEVKSTIDLAIDGIILK